MKDAFGVAAQVTIEQYICAQKTPHLKKSINQANLEIGTYEQIVSHLERELELTRLEALDLLQINTLTQQATQQNSKKPTKPTCHYCIKPSNYRSQCRQLKQGKDPARNNTNSADENNNNNSGGKTNRKTTKVSIAKVYPCQST